MDRFPAVVARPRLLARLATMHAPVRVLMGPRGSGKTAALHEYVARESNVAYIRLPREATKQHLVHALRSVDGAAQIALDDVDAIAPTALGWLHGLLAALSPTAPSYLLSATSRSRLRLQQLVATGTAEFLDAASLAFDRDEIAALCRSHDVHADESDVEQLLYDTEGWAVVVSWIVRDAARAGRSLRGAYDAWADRNDYLLLELITEGAEDANAETFRAVLAGKYAGDVQETLQRLEAAGYPIVRTRTTLRPYRVLRGCGAPRSGGGTSGSGILALRLFGRFSCTLDGRRVMFPRRREQNVLTYIALAPEASVSRAELMHVFWPDAPRSVASQGLRTTLSRLRRSIAAAAGCDAKRYLVVGSRIALDLAHVTIDARRFADHVANGRAEEARGNLHGLRDHYRFAERIYADALLASEAVDPPLIPRVTEYSAIFEAVRARLAQLQLSAAPLLPRLEVESAR